MDFGTAPRTAPLAGLPLVTRADVVATPGSVGVELAPEKTVQSAQAGEAVKLDIRAQNRDARARDVQSRATSERQAADRERQQRRNEQDNDRAVERKIVIEPRTRAIVMETKDQETGETISQLPDETMLKLRIYSRDLAERARDATEANRRQVELIA